MPQMSPLLWSNLFFLFSLLLLFSLIKIYFSTTKSIPTLGTNTPSSILNNMNWTW